MRPLAYCECFACSQIAFYFHNGSRSSHCDGPVVVTPSGDHFTTCYDIRLILPPALNPKQCGDQTPFWVESDKGSLPLDLLLFLNYAFAAERVRARAAKQFEPTLLVPVLIFLGGWDWQERRGNQRGERAREACNKATKRISSLTCLILSR